MDNQKLYLVGNIVGTHGIKGELKVINESTFDRFKKGNTLYIKKGDVTTKVEIASSRNHKDFILVGIKDKNNINDVLEYVNGSFYTDDHPKLENGRYYYDDLIGLDILDMENNHLGKVIDIIELPSGILLEVIKDNNEKVMIPFVEAFVKEIDLEKQTMNISPIEGLL